MREQDLEFNPEYKYAKGGSIIGIQDPYELENQGNRYLESQGIDTKKFGVVHYDGFGKNSKLLKDVKGKDDEGNLNPLFMYERTPQTKSMTKGFQRGKNIYAKGGKISDETYREVYYAHLYPEYDSMEQVKRDVNRLMKRENISMEELLNEIPDQWAKGGEIELGEISKVDLVSHWSSGKKYNYKGEDYLVSKLGGVRNDFFFQKNGNQYFLILDENNGKYFPSGLYAKGGEVKDYNLMVRKTPNSSWEFVNKRPMTYSDAEKMYEEYNNSGIKHHELDIHIDLPFAKGGKTKKFPVAVQRRVDEINEMLPKVNESGDYASTYAGSTMESYIILDKPIQIKGNYVYISEEDSRWGKYGFEKRYNVNDTRDVYESIKGRKALMSDLGIIKRAFTKLLKSEGKMAKGGELMDADTQVDYAKGGEVQVVNRFNEMNLPKDIYSNGNIYKGKASFMNGYNGYTSTKDDGYLIDDKGNYLTDKQGNNIVAKERRGVEIDLSKYAKGGIAKKSEYISNRDIVSLTHKKGGTKKTLKGSQLVDGAYAKKKIMRKKPTKSDQLSLLNKGGEIVRAYDVNLNSGVGTYAKGGKISKDDAIVKALKMGVDFNKDFHAQSFGGELTELAKETGYRKSKSSSGSTGRAFFEHLEKRYDKNPSSYDDMAKQMARGGKTYKNLSAKEKVKFRKMQEAAIKSYRKTQSKKMAVGGKTTMAGDTDFPNELLNYAKGGTIIKKGNRVRVVNTKNDGKEGVVVRNLLNGSYLLNLDNGKTPIVSFDNLMLLSRETYAKGGKVEIEKAKRKLREAKKTKISSAIDDASRELDRVSEKYGYFAKGGKFASGGNVSYNGWTNYATWVTSLEILDGIDWEEYNMGEPISAEQIEDYVQEVMEQSPNLALSFANRFLNDVNYREIAENANDDFDLDDGEKDDYAKGGKMKKPMIRYSGRR